MGRIEAIFQRNWWVFSEILTAIFFGKIWSELKLQIIIYVKNYIKGLSKRFVWKEPGEN